MLTLNRLVGFGAGGSRPFAGATALSATISGNSGSNGFTYRTVFAPGALSQFGDFSRFVFSSGSAGACNLTKAYVDILSGTYGFAGSFAGQPKQLLFSGVGTLNIGSSSTEGQSDIMSFPLGSGVSYVLSHYFSGVPAQAATSSLPSNVTQYFISGDDAATVSASGYSSNSVLNFLKRVEV